MELFSDKEYQVLEQTNVGPWLVSTVWLGVDHNVLGDTPAIFETMTFQAKPSESKLGPECECRRYATEAGALAGHAEIVARLKAEVH